MDGTRFTGQERYQLDDRLRVPVPPRYRNAFKPNGWVVIGADGVLEVHTVKSFDDACAEVDGMPHGRLKDQLANAFYGAAHEVTPDVQGRITLTPNDLAHGKLEARSKVVVAGAGKCLRIWREDAWDSQTPFHHDLTTAPVT